MEKTIFDLALKWLVPFILAGLSRYIIKTLNGFKTQISANSEGTKALLWDRLHSIYVDRVLNGDETITKDEYDIALSVYTAYHNLGGNGVGTKMIEAIKKLTISD